MSSMLKLEATNRTVCGFIVAVFIFAEHNPLDTSIMSSVMSSWFVFDLLLAPFPSIPKGRPVQQALSSKMAFELLTLTPISWHPNSDKAASKAVDFPVSDSPMATGIGQQPYASLPFDSGMTGYLPLPSTMSEWGYALPSSHTMHTDGVRLCCQWMYNLGCDVLRPNFARFVHQVTAQPYKICAFRVEQYPTWVNKGAVIQDASAIILKSRRKDTFLDGYWAFMTSL